MTKKESKPGQPGRKWYKLLKPHRHRDADRKVGDKVDLTQSQFERLSAQEVIDPNPVVEEATKANG
jgi:hypothetical protein